jgi:hypothetical protein
MWVDKGLLRLNWRVGLFSANGSLTIIKLSSANKGAVVSVHQIDKMPWNVSIG